MEIKSVSNNQQSFTAAKIETGGMRTRERKAIVALDTFIKEKTKKLDMKIAKKLTFMIPKGDEYKPLDLPANGLGEFLADRLKSSFRGHTRANYVVKTSKANKSIIERFQQMLGILPTVTTRSRDLGSAGHLPSALKEAISSGEELYSKFA